MAALRPRQQSRSGSEQLPASVARSRTASGAESEPSGFFPGSRLLPPRQPRRGSPLVSPMLNSENPTELFDPPEVWLERSAVDDDDEEDVEDVQEADDFVNPRSHYVPDRSGACSSHNSHRGSPARMAQRVPERKWWNAMYRQELLLQLVPQVLKEAFPDKASRRLHLAKHVAFQQMAFMAFVLLSANDTIVKSMSKKRLDGPDEPRDFPYAFSSVLLVSGILSVSIGSLAALVFDGWPGLRRCWDVRSIMRMTPISVMFHFATVLKFVSMRYLPPDMVALLSQMNLVLLAVVMRVVLRKRYNTSQWIALTLTSLAMLQYLTIRDGRKKGGVNASPAQLSPNVLEGLLVIAVMCVVETMASVFAEKYFKERRSQDMPFYIQKVHVDFSGCLFAALWCFVIEPVYLKDLNWSCKPHRCRQVLDQGLFSGWDAWTLAVLGLVVSKMWLSGLVAKILDSVVKQLGSCVAMVLTYLEVVWLYPQSNSFDFETSVALMVVVMAIASFAVSTRDSQTIERLHNASEHLSPSSAQREPPGRWGEYHALGGAKATSAHKQTTD
ncbi:unnamed protein product [Polarella glacialis]|uniref:Uncharacterized protein n=1 Tax=Polarella glacialis TaxID=89957 RepID=A0A813H4I1_POLGL|nr:unnamed protein product [Polarella glacialis]CAE8726626.1 unnamed protein product [Polarella glacialis]